MIVRGRNCVPVVGSSAPRSFSRPCRPARCRSPRWSRSSDAPAHDRGFDHHRSADLRGVAPSARNNASSRVRWAIRIENVLLKMMNAPTNREMPANTCSPIVRTSSWSLTSWRIRGRLLGARGGREARREDRLDPPLERLRGYARLRGDPDGVATSRARGAPPGPWRGRSPRTTPRPASLSFRPPRIRRSRPPWRDRRTCGSPRSADRWRSSFLRRPGIDRHLIGGLGRVALSEGGDRQGRIGNPRCAERRCAARGDRLPSVPTTCA